MGFLRRLFGNKKPTNPRPDKDVRRRWSFSTRSSPNNKHDDQLHLDANKHAIAVAAATAAVAEAALAAAHAAAEVVRLTSAGPAAGPSHHRLLAAIKIQSAFRAYLHVQARRALRALKALVKLQALVRGHIVRKQTSDMLRRMQTLVRLQARARASRTEPLNTSTKFSNSRDAVPASPDNDEYHFRAYSTKYDASSILKRCGSNTNLRDITAIDKAKMGSNWLDRWMEDSSIWNSSRDTSMRHAHVDDEKSDKILEVDTWKPRLNFQHSSRMLRTIGESPRKMSPKPAYPGEAPPAPSATKAQDQATARIEDNSPHVHSASSRQGSSSARRSPFTPTRSECSWGYLNGYSSHPNYMEYTESSRAKFRSQSAPRQRIEVDRYGSMNRSLQGLWEGSSNEREYSECRVGAYLAPERLSRPGTPNRR